MTAEIDGAERTDAGKLFHARGPVIGNKRSPTVTNRDRGTKRISVSADDLSRRLESMSTTRCSDDMTGRPTEEQNHEDNC